MALPIGETPVLKGKDAVNFITMIRNDEKNPVSLIATPKLDKALKLIEKHAKCQSKLVH